VTDYGGGFVRRFATDADGQHAGNFTNVVFYGGNSPTGLAKVGSHTYMTRQNSGQVVEIDTFGNFIRNVVNIGFATGLVADPTNGHLLVSNGGDIFDVDPVTNSVGFYIQGAHADGLTFTADGSDLYAAINGNSVQGFHRGSSIPFFNVSVAAADGTALGTGSLAGNIFVNSNFGFLEEINLANPALQTTIFTGGTRGDFVTVDPNGTLIISQSDRLLRLTARAVRVSKAALPSRPPP